MNVAAISSVAGSGHRVSSSTSSAQLAAMESFNTLLAFLWGPLDGAQEGSDAQTSEPALTGEQSSSAGDVLRSRGLLTPDQHATGKSNDDVRSQSGIGMLAGLAVSPQLSSPPDTGLTPGISNATTANSSSPTSDVISESQHSDSNSASDASEPGSRRGLGRACNLGALDAAQFVCTSAVIAPQATATNGEATKTVLNKDRGPAALAADFQDNTGEIGTASGAVRVRGELSFAAQLTDRLMSLQGGSVPATRSSNQTPREIKPEISAVSSGNTTARDSGLVETEAELNASAEQKSSGKQNATAQNGQAAEDAQEIAGAAKLKTVEKPAEPQNGQPDTRDSGKRANANGVVTALPQGQAPRNISISSSDSKADRLESSQQILTKTEINSGIRPPPTREISIKIGGDSGGLDLRVSDRGGKVQVAVRTADAELSSSLRSNLDELVSRLERKGFSTETWTPSSLHRGVATGDSSSGGADDSTWRDQGSEQGRQEQRRQHEQQEQPQDRNTPRWAEEITRRFPSVDSNISGETN